MQRSKIVLGTLEVVSRGQGSPCGKLQKVTGAEDEDEGQTQGSSFAHVHVSKGNSENDVPCDCAQRKSGKSRVPKRVENSRPHSTKKKYQGSVVARNCGLPVGEYEIVDKAQGITGGAGDFLLPVVRGNLRAPSKRREKKERKEGEGTNDK